MEQTQKIIATIVLPEDSVMIKKSEYEKLTSDYEARPAFETKAWLKKKIGITNEDKLYKRLLTPFQEELDMKNGGPIHYSTKSGDPMAIKVKQFEEWLDKNYRRIFE